MKENLKQFVDKKYLNLETFRKNGVGIKTPVWFTVGEESIYVITREGTGKVKRLANNSTVKLVPCSFKGEPEGQWASGIAKKMDEIEMKKAVKLRKKKYGIKALLIGFMTKSKGELVAYSITLN